MEDADLKRALAESIRSLRESQADSELFLALQKSIQDAEAEQAREAADRAAAERAAVNQANADRLAAERAAFDRAANRANAQREALDRASLEEAAVNRALAEVATQVRQSLEAKILQPATELPREFLNVSQMQFTPEQKVALRALHDKFKESKKRKRSELRAQPQVGRFQYDTTHTPQKNLTSILTTDKEFAPYYYDALVSNLSNHPNIRHIDDIQLEYRPDKRVDIRYEWAPSVPLGYLLHNLTKRSLGVKQLAKIFLDILCAVEELERSHIVHRDIGPESILVNNGKGELSNFIHASHVDTDPLTPNSSYHYQRNYEAWERGLPLVEQDLWALLSTLRWALYAALAPLSPEEARGATVGVYDKGERLPGVALFTLAPRSVFEESKGVMLKDLRNKRDEVNLASNGGLAAIEAVLKKDRLSSEMVRAVLENFALVNGVQIPPCKEGVFPEGSVMDIEATPSLSPEAQAADVLYELLVERSQMQAQPIKKSIDTLCAESKDFVVPGESAFCRGGRLFANRYNIKESAQIPAKLPKQKLLPSLVRVANLKPTSDDLSKLAHLSDDQLIALFKSIGL